MEKNPICHDIPWKKLFSREFQFRMFVRWKDLWGHADGSTMKPTDIERLSRWETIDAKIISWILNYVDPHLLPNLRPYQTAKGKWD